MLRPNYVPIEGCPLCDRGYNSVPCHICGGLGGRCSNPKCVNGEVAVAHECNQKPYERQEEKKQ